MSKLMAGAFALALATSLSSFLAPAQAEEYPWCAQYTGGNSGIGASNCGFVTLEQCRETISGIGGICHRNPRYHGVVHPRDRAYRIE
jgi:Protein of unknown function (DUF3551)